MVSTLGGIHFFPKILETGVGGSYRNPHLAGCGVCVLENCQPVVQFLLFRMSPSVQTDAVLPFKQS